MLYSKKPKNAAGIQFAEHEAGYLVGYLAALQLKSQGGPQIISAVGANNVPAIVKFISGYIQGAKKANPRIRVLANYANDPTFSDQAKCKETALAQIQKGTRAIFQVAGGCGLGALTAAKQAKIWGIGVDADQLYLGRHMLTSALKRVDVAVEDITRLASQGKFKPQADYQYSLKNNGVGLGSVNTQGEEELRRSHERDRQADRRGQDQGPADHQVQGVELDARSRGWGLAPPPRIARDERGTTRSRAPGDHEAVSGDTRERPRRLRPPPGRGARAARRERRGQVDAHEHPLRALQPGRGRDPDQRRAGADRVAAATRSRAGSAWCTSTSC